jgi:predicted N-acetyltransferase YhbS
MPEPAPDVERDLSELFGRVWPRLPGAIRRAAALGFSWRAVSTPFVRREHGRAVAHVGVIEQPLVVAGERRRVGFIHAVCTDPAQRRRGHARALLEAALAHCGGRCETQVLTTQIPDFYARFGFRVVPQHAFSRPLPRPRAAAVGHALSETAADGRRLRRLLAARAPVSERLGTCEDGTVFVFALLLTWGDLSRARYHESLDVVTVHEVHDRTLVLYDVAGATIPPLPALAEAIGADADRVVTLFVPDRLGDGFTAEPWDARRAAALGDHDFVDVMVRGPLDVAGPFMLPALART